MVQQTPFWARREVAPALRRGGSAGWQPISTAPKDGSPIWGFLYETGIQLLRWASPRECADYEGASDPDDYDGCWVEVSDFDDDWSPQWWKPFGSIGLPPGATIKGLDALGLPAADTTERQTQIPGGNP